jgi:prolyl oligopeptidase
VTDNYHGIEVVDNYRWLENGNDPAVQNWNREQNKRTYALLNQIPAFEAIRTRVRELMSATRDIGALSYSGTKLFAMKHEPPKEQPFLITFESPDNPESAHVVVDPNAINSRGTTSIDFYVPSFDGQLVAISLSESGSEKGTGYVYEVNSGKRLSDIIPNLNFTAGGSLTWNATGTGFYYTRCPREGERPKEDMNFYEQVYFHRLGTSSDDDVYSVGKEFPKIASTQLETSPEGKHILATVENGDGGEFSHYLLKEGEEWEQITQFSDEISAATFGHGGALYMLSHKGAPRGKILQLETANLDLAQAETIVEESDLAIDGFSLGLSGLRPKFVATSSSLFVPYVAGGPSEIFMVDLSGHRRVRLPIPEISSVGQMLTFRRDEILFECQSYTEPSAWYHYIPTTWKIERTRLFRTSKADLSYAEVTREFAASKDGTEIPINIIRRKGTKLDRRNPTLLTGYGGFNLSLRPTFSELTAVWLEQGGIQAVANLRGGGEYGEDWHKAGRLTRKQNVFDDFIACAEHLINHKHTGPERLAVQGGSNGGLLMGAALTQRPELFRAVVSHVGIYDMLRVEQYPNGEYNATEYGSIKNPEQFRPLYAYSPYHQVKDGTAYPAVFLLAGENDARVDPFHSRKMAARLQAATSSNLPILLLVSLGSGHGLNTALSERIDQEAYVYAFLFHYLGMEYKHT